MNFKNINLENSLQTAQGMCEFCTKYQELTNFNQKNSLRHFDVIEKALIKDEQVIFPFYGTLDYKSPSNNSGNFAFVLTNCRLLFGQQKLLPSLMKKLLQKRFIMI